MRGTDHAFIDIEGSIDCPHCHEEADFNMAERNSRDHAAWVVKCDKCSGMAYLALEIETVPKQSKVVAHA